MGEDGKKRRRSVGKLETRGNRPQAVRALDSTRVHQKAGSEQRVQLQLEFTIPRTAACVRSS